MQSGWWVLQDPLGLLGTQASRDPTGTLALGAFLASWAPWVRLATQGPRVSAVLWWGWGPGDVHLAKARPRLGYGLCGLMAQPLVFSFIIPPLRMRYTFPHSLSKVFQKSYVTPGLAFSVAN